MEKCKNCGELKGYETYTYSANRFKDCKISVCRFCGLAKTSYGKRMQKFYQELNCRKNR